MGRRGRDRRGGKGKAMARRGEVVWAALAVGIAINVVENRWCLEDMAAAVE